MHRRSLLAALGSPAVLLAIGVVPLALLLRVSFLGRASYCLDEVTSVAIVHLDWPTFVRILVHREANMTAYYLLLRLWSLLGENEGLTRSLSLIFSLATLPVLYALGARLFGPRVGLIASLLLAVNALHILYAQIARGYSLVVFLLTLAGLFFVQGIEQPSRRAWAGYAVSIALAVYSHLFALFVWSSHWVSLGLLRGRTIPWRLLGIATAAAILAIIPLVAAVVTGDAGQVSWIPRPDARAVMHVLGVLTGGGERRLLLYTALCALAFATAAQLSYARDRSKVMAHVEVSLRSGFDAWRYWFLVAWIFVPLILAFAISFRKSIFAPDYFIVCLPPLMILVAAGIARLRPVGILAAVLAIVVGVAIRGDVRRVPNGEDWKGATAEVLAEGRSEDALLFYHPYMRQAFELYRGRADRSHPAPTVVFPGPWDPSIDEVDVPARPSRALLASLPPRYPRVWLVTGHDDIPQLGRDRISHDIQTALSQEYPYRRVDRFRGGITVQLYSQSAPPRAAAGFRSRVMPECP